MGGGHTHSLTVLPLSHTHSPPALTRSLSLTSHSHTAWVEGTLTHSLTDLPLSHTEWRAHSLSHSLIRSSLKSHTHRVLTGVPLSQTE